ncbi:DUF3000 domain-containing protein [Serinibacter salmoneus]|uniref:DUF3000 family protein n=1 Tax=Serinibacter salmoneus TaxID=556530 RepID=A0A2A9CZL4_9MICO|nr:DUF3000 domain-containing protein [Serinibacter salmoneus]PFG19566.1 Protein of unknown function (DUF3000) [Serinibacter salmoneus]
MSTTDEPGLPEEFEAALLSLRGVQTRPEVHLEEVPPPTRIAPWALALTAEVNATGEVEDMLGNGRFVVLHDPEGQEAWEGTFRVVVLVRATLEDELGEDPLLGQVAWSWLTDSLHEAGASYHALSGTVTRVLSETFGGLEVRENQVEIEIRASWTPHGTDLSGHLAAWATATAWAGGLPPLPANVTTLAQRRRRG